MARGVIRRIRLHLDDAAADAAAENRPPEQAACDVVQAALKQLLRARAQE